MSSYTTMASLIRGETEKFVEEFYWYLLHSSASHAFPEGIFFRTRFAWHDTISHVTDASNFAFMLRHALVHENGDELDLLLGVPDWWLDDGKEIRVENAPTHFGPMSLRVRGKENGVELHLNAPQRQPPRRIFVHLPKSRPLLRGPQEVLVVLRPEQTRRWDYPGVIETYQRTAETAKRQ